ncbi:MAG: DUF72 domain-containing protein [Acidimicrobiales bacterium]
MSRIRVGTSGWSYPAWVGPFYPEGTSPARMLGVYASTFDTVEAHATYRRLPSATALGRWVDTVPAGFRFATKAHMGITHRRDLEGVEDRVDALLAALAPLGPTLGPVLFSLPHQQPDLHRLDRILAALAGRAVTAAFDLGPAWDRPDVLDRLDRAGATLVVTDGPAIPAVGPVAYVRLRAGGYSAAELDAWAERVAKVVAEDRDAYVFFKHDDAATGPRLAQELRARG